ncbi:hypothetical protein [Actinosynnema sp. NPDC020468]|uniref:hypothetical protein n=1 Tax=Actinosynnema sp. NPDC020468 TaxID=3154488 RepID=UPI0033C451F1
MDRYTVRLAPVDGQPGVFVVADGPDARVHRVTTTLRTFEGTEALLALELDVEGVEPGQLLIYTPGAFKMVLKAFPKVYDGVNSVLKEIQAKRDREAEEAAAAAAELEKREADGLARVPEEAETKGDFERGLAAIRKKWEQSAVKRAAVLAVFSLRKEITLIFNQPHEGYYQADPVRLVVKGAVRAGDLRVDPGR